MSEEKTGNVVKSTEFKTAGDWINEIMSKYCGELKGAQDAVEEVKDDEGNVVTKAVPARVGKMVTDAYALSRLAAENSLKLKDSDHETGGYPNVGMMRMNIGNMARAAARKRHGLNLPTDEGLIDADTNFEFVEAPEGFAVNEDKTQNPDGSRIVKDSPKSDKETSEAAA